MTRLLVKYLRSNFEGEPVEDLLPVTRIDDDGHPWTWYAGEPRRVCDVLDQKNIAHEDAWLTPIEAVDATLLRREFH